MAESNDDVLKKADALMHRHRVFVAGATAEPETPPDTGPEDVPTLTEIVDADSLQQSAPRVQTPVDLAALSSALSMELETWLDAELPQHVLRVLDGVTDQLITQVALKARTELLPKLQGVVDSTSQAANPDPTDK